MPTLSRGAGGSKGALKTHLAHLRRNEFGEGTEERIKNTMLEGSTFFHYTLRDSKEEFRSTFAFVTLTGAKGDREPSLLLHFGLSRGIEEAKNYKQSLKQKTKGRLLP